MTKCPLCDPIEKKTRWYYVSEKFVILDCETCGIPMIVYRRHNVDPFPNDLEEIKRVARNLFGESITFRTKHRKILDHWHWHIEGAK